MKNQQIKILNATNAIFLSFSFLLLININFTSCKSTQNQQNLKTQQNQANQIAGSSPADLTQNFSHNTIIVYLENGISEEEIRVLAERHNLKVLYIYKNFSSCALSSEKPLTDKELNLLIKNIEKEPHVLSVQKDYTMSLD